MILFQTTDHHIKDEEPFFQAGKALDNWLIDYFKQQTEPFVYLDSGDRFHLSKETGRVNGEVTRFFLELSAIPNCKEIWVLQGNHDFKVDTGSALNSVIGLSDKITVVFNPVAIQFPEQKDYTLLLPHMKIKHFPYYNGKESYGKEEFYKTHFKDWEKIKNRIEFISAHVGDETCGELFKDTDLSLFKCTKSNGHIHKTVSINQLESASVTRRDEADKKCIMRKWDTRDFNKFEEISLPLFLNYIKISYGADLEEELKSHIKPVTSLIVDIIGHDNEDFVRTEYLKKFEDSSNPKYYLGEIFTEDRITNDSDLDSKEREDLDVSDADLIKLFKEFCDEKKVSDSVKQKILKKIS